MPTLDRIVTVKIEAPGMRNSGTGEYIPGPVTDYRVWCQVSDGGSFDEEGEAGIRIVQIKQFTVRYFEALNDTSPNFVSVVDEDGRTWNCQNIRVHEARRRVIIIEGAWGG